MGINFYWKKVQPWFLEHAKNPNVSEDDDENILLHIGKRSGAGLYCQTCGCTNLREGTREVHKDIPFNLSEKEQERLFFKECPCCGTPFERENATSTCSFTWTLKKHKSLVLNLLRDKCEEKVIRDEYGTEYTAFEFYLNEIAGNCAIEFQCAARFG